MAAPAAPAPVAPRRLRLPAGAWAAGILAAAASVAALALTATGARAPLVPHSRAAANPNGLIHGAPLQRATCSDWNAASGADRALAVSALATTVGGPTEFKGVRGTKLNEAESYQLLDRACAGSIARNFLLYQLYIRAAGFRALWAQP